MVDIIQVGQMKKSIGTLSGYGFFPSEKLTTCFIDLLRQLDLNSFDFKIESSIKNVPAVPSYKIWVSLNFKSNDLSVSYASEGHMVDSTDKQLFIKSVCYDYMSVCNLFDKYSVEVDPTYDLIECEKNGCSSKCFISELMSRDSLILDQVDKVSSTRTLFKSFIEIAEKVL